MKKKLIFIIAVATALLGVLVFSLQPREIIKNVDLLTVHRIDRTMESGEQVDITNQLDLNLLCHALAEYKCSRIPKSFAPYQMKDVVYEITGIYDEKPIHILVGTINIVYMTSNKGGFQIKNSNALLAEINLLLASYFDNT